MTVSRDLELHALDHAWRYFELHAAQRLSMFNFFVAFSTLALAGMGAIVQAGAKLAIPGIMVGTMIPIVSFIFWKLDGRTAHLVKLGETSLRSLETELYPAAAHIFCIEPEKSAPSRSERNYWRRMFSYREAFASIFIIVAVLGFGGAALSAYILLKSCAKVAPASKNLQTRASTAIMPRRQPHNESGPLSTP